MKQKLNGKIYNNNGQLNNETIMIIERKGKYICYLKKRM